MHLTLVYRIRLLLQTAARLWRSAEPPTVMS